MMTSSFKQANSFPGSEVFIPKAIPSFPSLLPIMHPIGKGNALHCLPSVAEANALTTVPYLSGFQPHMCTAGQPLLPGLNDLSSTEGALMLADSEIQAAIETENRITKSKKQVLTNLHDEYHAKLEKMKQYLERLKQKSKVMKQVFESQAGRGNIELTLRSLLEKKRNIYQSYAKTQSARMSDQQKLNKVDSDNQNLNAILESLNHQLKRAINEYQMLCASRPKSDFSRNNEAYEQPDCSAAISNNEEFREMLKENRMLERQIKFLKHIIQKETGRQSIISAAGF